MSSATSGRALDPVQLIDNSVAEYRVQTRTPGVCVAVYYPKYFGEPGLVRPYGLARLKPVIEVDNDTVFGIGSVTKVFTSLLLACAVEQGNAKLADPVIQYLSRQYDASGSNDFDAIRLWNLATHTSGMPGQAKGTGQPGYQLFADEGPSADMLNYWAGYSGPKVPACWEYSNTAFVTLGFAITALFPGLLGNQYNRLLQEYVTGPLGLTRTSAQAPETSFAKGYNRHGESLEQTPAPGVAADLKSTAPDLLKLMKAYLGAPRVEGLLGKAVALTAREVGEFQICKQPGKKMGMGLAWQIGSPSGYRLYTKDGSTAEGGFSCMVEFAPDFDFGVVVLTNQVWHDAPQQGFTHPGSLAQRIRKMLLPDASPAASLQSVIASGRSFAEPISTVAPAA